MEKLQSLYRNVGIRTAGALSLFAPIAAMADPADPFTDALSTATTKVGTYAAALVGLGAVAVVFMIGLKYVKKIAKAS